LYVHRRRYGRARWRRRRLAGRQAAAAVFAGVILAAVVHANARGTAAALTGGAAPNRAAAQAIAYARAQLGKPYIWGGTGPDGFDCSGLVMMAYAADGISIPRTSQDQWAELPHIPAGHARPGDLVFFPGGDGTWSAPGHVALVISATQMIQAYAPGTPVEISPLNGDGAGGIVGFARPGGA
jgi:cell wall-associated NlpC family hydrolase